MFGWLYALSVFPFRASLSPGSAAPTRQIICFYSGLVMFYIAVGSPIDALGENYLFCVHMFQHILLMYVCPPLFILGIPSWLVDATLGRSMLASRAFKFCVHPVVAGASFTLIFSAWHVPSLYEWALQNKLVHIIEHLSILLPGLGVWWCFLSPSRQFPRLHGGLQMLFIFGLMIGQLPVFAFLVFADHVYYPTYQFAPRIIELSAMEDQVMGGVVMKASNLIVSVVIFAMGFYALSQDAEN